MQEPDKAYLDAACLQSMGIVRKGDEVSQYVYIHSLIRLKP